MDKILASPIPIVVVNGDTRHVDGDLLKVGPAVTVQLCVEVRVDAALKERVLGEVDAADDVAGLKLDI